MTTHTDNHTPGSGSIQPPGLVAQLDAWLPDPAVRVRHSRRIEASPDAVWAAAASVRLKDTPTLGRLVRWRIPGLGPDLSYRDLFRETPFTVLAEEGHASLSGLAGRIWTLKRDYAHLGGAEDFAAWDEGGTVRVLFAHWVQLGPDGVPELVSEARVQPTDRRAAVRLKAVWSVVGRFAGLVAAEPMTVAARRARRPVR